MPLSRAIGPIPPQTFLDHFLPLDTLSKRKIRKDTFKRVKPDWVTDDHIRQSLVSTVNCKQLCPGYNLVFITPETFQNSAHGHPSPTVALFHNDVERTSWTHMEFFVQAFNEGSADPFQYDFPASEEDISAIRAVRVQKQLLQYAAIQMGHQHRLFTFALGIYGRLARFYRFDPSCIVVSEIFDYHDEPQTLAEFFLRYSTLSSAERGFDPTIIPATDAEKELYRLHIGDYLERVKEQNLRQYPRIRRVLTGDIPILKIQVSDMDGKAHWYLGYRPPPPRLNSDPYGRLTRGYVVLPVSSLDRSADGDDGPSHEKCDEGKLYWLKDCWRTTNADSETEKYLHLKSRGVRNLPELVHGGDVLFGGEYQESENDSFLDDPNIPWTAASLNIQHMRHHRLVQSLLIPLWRVESARELVRAGRDSLEAIVAAYYDAHLLHQDVSVGNVMLTEEWSDGSKESGVLIDWDRAEELESLSQRCRMGTWQFASVTLIQDSAKPHDVIDDLESVLWVLIFTAIRRFKYNGNFFGTMFDEQYTLATGERGGGAMKTFWLSDEPHGRFGHFECRPLQQLFTNLRAFHYQRLQKIQDSECIGSKETLDALEQCIDEILKDLRKILLFFDDILNDPTADWSGGSPIPSEKNEKKPEKKNPPKPTKVPVKPVQAQGRGKRQRQDDGHENDHHPAKRTAGSQNVKNEASKPPRRKQKAPPLPQKVYNLRPRKK